MENGLVMLGEGTIHPEAQRSWRRWAPEGGVFPDEDPEALCPDDRNEVLQTPTVWYFLSLPLSECEPAWFEITRLGQLSPADLLGIGSAPSLEPLDALSYLRRAPGEVTEVDRSEGLTRYRLAAELVEGETLDVWIDGDGHVRRIVFEGEPRTTIELSDVGSAPTVPARPDGEVRQGDWIIDLYSQGG